MQAPDFSMRANRMPAPTWSWLKINETTIDLPQGLAPAGTCAVELTCSPELLAAPSVFMDTLSDLDSSFTSRRGAAPGDAADRARVAGNIAGALDVPALSEYQMRALELEQTFGPAQSFTHGMGEDATMFLRATAQEPICLVAPQHSDCTAHIRITGVPQYASAADISVVAEAGSHLSITIHLDSPQAGSGIVGNLLSVVARAHARVEVVCVQTLDDSWCALDSSGFTLDESAHVSVSHVVLGAGKAYTGFAGELWGERARLDVKTSYVGRREQERDFNYQIRHLGKHTTSTMFADGVLAGTARKTLRGTIDLVHGCAGAEGTERETVLLADEGVENKTVPTILCDEDDVAGNHGATIGHVRPDQLFYLTSRGLSPEKAEELFLVAQFEAAVLNADDEQIVSGVKRIAGDIAALFEEE